MTTFVREHKYNSDLNNLLNQYLRIIPQNLGMKKFSAETILPDDNSLQKQLDLVTSLESSYQALQTTKPVISNVPTEEVFKVDMDVLNDNTERTRLNNFFEGSKKKMHGYDNIRVKEMYKVDIHDVTNSFNSKLTPIHEVFHGSSCSNILSILKSGLKISPPSTAVIAGKMMGNGIYGAINSSKSIGYTFGKWTNTGGDMGYLIICDFAMGKIKTVYNSCSEPTEHDSVWAKAGSGLYNDELIVYKNSQCKIKYLLEIK
jgi:poly [ADP-ribose] polymerase